MRNSNSKQIENKHQWQLLASNISCYLLLLYYASANALNIYQISSLMIGILFLHFFITSLHIILTCEQLHYIHIKRKRSSLGKKNKLFIPYKYQDLKTVPLKSYSSLIGLRGTNAEKNALALGYTIIGIMLVTITINMILLSIVDNYADIAMLFSICGWWILLTWSIEDTRLSHPVHLTGVAMACIGAYTAYFIRYNSSEFVIISSICAVIHAIGWILIADFLKVKKEYIHYQSLLALVLETVVLLKEMSIMCFYFYYL